MIYDCDIIRNPAGGTFARLLDFRNDKIEFYDFLYTTSVKMQSKSKKKDRSKLF